VTNHFTVPLAGPIDEVNRRRSNRAVYVQQLINWEKRFVLQGGVRMDKNSQFGTVWNPKVSSAYEIGATRTRIRGNWGTGFHAPTFRDLYHPIFGNPDLDPEETRSWEVGVNQPVLGRTIVLDAAFFRMDFHHLIQRSPTGVGNIGKARTQGVEATVSVYPVSFLWIDANYTYLGAEDRETGERLPYRPRHLANIGLHYAPILNLMVILDVSVVSDQALTIDFIQTDGGLLEGKNPGYTRVNLSADYRVFKILPWVRETKFFVTVRNLFDRNYEEVPGFPSPGVAFLAGLASDF
jgi:vitamin B12 transporter